MEIDCTDSTQVRAASIKMKPGPWQAFVYSTAESKTLKKITLHWETTTMKGILVDTDYPYEFSVTVAANDDTFKFKVEAVKVNGEIINIEETTIGVVSN